MNKEEQMLQKRLLELSSIAYQRDIVTFSDFLNLNELHILQSIPKNELSTRYELFGGYEYAERQMVAFLPDALCYEYFYPMKTVIIEPLNLNFSESLTHRDYLGALMNYVYRQFTGNMPNHLHTGIISVHFSILVLNDLRLVIWR